MILLGTRKTQGQPRYVSVIFKVLKLTYSLGTSQEIKHLPWAPPYVLPALIETPVYSHDEFRWEYWLLLRQRPPVIGPIRCNVVDSNPADITGLAALLTHRTTVTRRLTVATARSHHPHQPFQNRPITRTSTQVPCNSRIGVREGWFCERDRNVCARDRHFSRWYQV